MLIYLYCIGELVLALIKVEWRMILGALVFL